MSRRSSPTFVACAIVFLSFILLGHLSGGDGCSEWCVASKEASEKVVQKALDWVCRYGSACDRIKTGQPCYKSNDLRDVASVAFNQYWQAVKHGGTSCDHLFGATTLVHTDPSHGNCTMPCV